MNKLKLNVYDPSDYAFCLIGDNDQEMSYKRIAKNWYYDYKELIINIGKEQYRIGFGYGWY